MEQESLGFSEFRQLMDMWDEAVENQERKDIQSLVEGNDFVLFFVKDGIVFGAPEESRLTFARMKHPDDDENDESWLKEATFTAYNLTRALEGDQAEALFGYKDLPKIKIISSDEAIRLLSKGSQKISDKTKTGLAVKTRDDMPANMDQIDEK